MTVQISATNDPPVAVDDPTNPIVEDVTTTLANLRNNDSDPDGDLFSITATTDGTKGVVTIISAGTAVSYDPNPNATGTDTFTYTISDGHGGTDTGTVTVQITPVNDPPAGTNKTITIDEDGAHTFTTADFGFTDPNDSPPDDLDAVRITTLPGAGTLRNNGVLVTTGQLITVAAITGGDLTFTPAANGTGSPYASFTFQVRDDGGTTNGGVNLDASANTITINVTGLNSPPAGANRTITTNEDTAHAFTTAEFGFTDPNDSPADALAAVKITTLPVAGTLRTNGTPVSAGQDISAAAITGGDLTFTPAINANGTSYASFTFQVRDNGGTAGGGVDLDPTPNTITINVTPVNDPPTGTNDTYLVAEDSGPGVVSVLGNDTDVDGPAKTVPRRPTHPTAR